MALLYATSVFVGFMALAHLVFHSAEAVKALALTAIGALVTLVPTVLARTEYRLTASGRKALERYLDHMEALIERVRE